MLSCALLRLFAYRGQHLGNVHRAAAAALPTQASIDLCHTRGVAGDDDLGAGRLDLVDLALQHRLTDMRQLDRKEPAEAAALLGARQIDEVRTFDVTQQCPRLFL